MNLVAEGKRNPGPTRYEVNIRLVLLTIVFLVVAVPVVYFWHSYSVKKISYAFLEQANSLIEEADKLNSEQGQEREAAKTLNKAVDMIWQYRRTQPDDQPSAILMAKTFDRSAQGNSSYSGRRRAAQLYVEAIALSSGPELVELKTKVGDIMLEIKDFDEAGKIGQQLIELAKSENDSTASAEAAGARIFAISLFGQLSSGMGRSGPTDLGAAFSAAIEKNPMNTELPILLATIYRDENLRTYLSESQQKQLTDSKISHAQKADEIIDQMVDRNKALASAHLNRFLYRMRVAEELEATNSAGIENLIHSAELDLNKAWEIDPEDPVINLQMGRSLQRQLHNANSFVANRPSQLRDDKRATVEKARKHFENCVRLKPEMHEAWLNLGEAQSVLGFPDEAIQSWSTAMELTELESAPQLLQSVLRHHTISLLIELDRLDEAQVQLDKLNEFITAFSKRAGNPQQFADLIYLREFLVGFLKYKRNEYGEAISILEKLLPENGQEMGPWTLDVIRLLGGLHLELDQSELAANAYRIAIELDRSNIEFKYLLSKALARNGQFGLSTDALESVVQVSNSAIVCLEYAETLLEQERRKSPEFRNLEPIKSAIQKARELSRETPLEKPWRLDIVQLQTVLAGRLDSSEGSSLTPDSSAEFDSIAAHLESEFGDQADLLKALAALYQMAGKREDLQRLIEKYATLAGDSPDHLIFVASMQTGEMDFDAARNTLENGLSRVKDQEKLPIQLAQVSLLFRQGEFDAGIEQLEKIADQNANAPEVIVRIADLLIKLPNLIGPQPAKWESGLQKLEGENGPLASMLNVHRLLLEYDNTEDLNQREELLLKAGNLCGSIKFLRPNWAPVHSLHGLVLELQQNAWIKKSHLNQRVAQLPDAERLAAGKLFPAKQSYQLAIELGERRPFVFIRLADLESDPVARRNLLAQIDQEMVATNSDLSNMRMAALVAGNDLDNALKMAEFATQKRPSDPLAWIALARIELMNGAIDKSVTSIDKAKLLVDTSDSPVEVKLNLFRFFSSAHHFSESDNVVQSWVDEARSMIPGILELVDAQIRLLLHAELLEELGDETASDLFLQAVDKSPEDKMVLERALGFFGSPQRSETGSIDRAIDIANKLVNIDPANSEYVQVLARLLSNRGTGSDWTRITELLDGKNIENRDSVENQRIMAILLLSRTNVPNSERLANLKRAFDIIREYQSASDLLLAGQILRAWSLVLTGNDRESMRAEKLDEAEVLFQKASTAADVSPVQLVVITEFFLERGKSDPGKWEIADSLIQELQNLPSNSIFDNAPIISLSARLRHARGKDNPESIVRFVEEYGASVEKESRSLARNVRAQLLKQIAGILDGIDAKHRALVWHEKAAALDTKLQLSLAFERAKNGNLNDALQQCIQGYEETGLPDFVILIAQFLLTENGSPEHFQQAESVFNSALEKHSDNLALILSIGNARIGGQSRIEDAIELYERALKIDPTNQTVMNNLATAYTELPERLPDALLTINRALARYGNVPGLLDTKAVILMQQNELAHAEKILTDIVNQISDSRFYWHLAEVHWKQYEKSQSPDDLERARLAFDQSIRMGLEKQILTPGEKKRLSTLRDNLDSLKIGARRPDAFPVSGIYFQRTSSFDFAKRYSDSGNFILKGLGDCLTLNLDKDSSSVIAIHL